MEHTWYMLCWVSNSGFCVFEASMLSVDLYHESSKTWLKQKDLAKYMFDYYKSSCIFCFPLFFHAEVPSCRYHWDWHPSHIFLQHTLHWDATEGWGATCVFSFPHVWFCSITGNPMGSSNSPTPRSLTLKQMIFPKI